MCVSRVFSTEIIVDGSQKARMAMKRLSRHYVNDCVSFCIGHLRTKLLGKRGFSGQSVMSPFQALPFCVWELFP